MGKEVANRDKNKFGGAFKNELKKNGKHDLAQQQAVGAD